MIGIVTSGPKGLRPLLAVVALACMALFAPRPAHAQKLGSDVIAMFPKEVGEFAIAFEGERVLALGTIERDGGDAPLDFKQEVARLILGDRQ